MIKKFPRKNQLKNFMLLTCTVNIFALYVPLRYPRNITFMNWISAAIHKLRTMQFAMKELMKVSFGTTG